MNETRVVIITVVLLFLSSSLAVSSQTTNTNISLGSTLTAGSNSSWNSSSGDFTFGFYNLTDGHFLVGIWFPDRTLVWSANRDDPARTGSTINLTTTGHFMLTHSNGTQLTVYNGSSAAASSALMQDDGNFVLQSSSGEVIWQSFDHPTDTLLLGQKLTMGQKLYSNNRPNNGSSSLDYSTGRFKLEVQQQDGNVVLSAHRYTDPGYWNTITSGNTNVSLVFNKTTALMYVVNGSSSVISNMSTSSGILTPLGDYYYRATVNGVGNFQQLAYQKDGRSEWRIVWEAITEPCRPVAVCGVFGFCNSSDNRIVTCNCLPGYKPWDPSNPYNGCYPEVVMDFCSPETSSSDFTIEQINNADFPNDQFADLERFGSMDVNGCRQKMIDDCFCMAAVLDGSVCIKKRLPLLNGRESNPFSSNSNNNNNNKVAFIKVPNVNGTSQARDTPSSAVLFASLLICFVSALVFAAITAYHHPLTRPCIRREPPAKPNPVEINLRSFSFSDLFKATEGFKNKLGQGAFGVVYSGVLTLEDGSVEVAVKQLEKERVVGRGEKEFLTEVQVIGLTHHRNLVRLVGFCYENSHRLLVYELMKNGSLYDFLFTREKPSWGDRAELVHGIAQGLTYLHEECETLIIHCDIKPQNVLLDDKLTAKIADFGLAKLMMEDKTKTNTHVRGTMGYMAPEWLKNAPVTEKVDVYSFGVLLLEMVLCRRHVELNQVDDDEVEACEMILIDWVVSCARLGNFRALLDDDLEVVEEFERFKRMVMVGLWCITPNPSLRPSMKKVVQMLEGSIEMDVPPVLDAPMFRC